MDTNALCDGHHWMKESTAMLHCEFHASTEIHESCRDGPCEANLSSSALLSGDFVGKSFSFG